MSSDSRFEYWASALRNPTIAALPTDFARPVPLTVVEAKHVFAFPESVVEAVKELAIVDGDSTESFSAYTVALTAFVVLVFRLTGDEDIVIGANSANDEPVVIRTSTTGQLPFIELLKTVHKLEVEGAAKSVPFADLISYLKEKSRTSEAPSLFRLSFLRSGDEVHRHLLAPIEGLVTDMTVFVDESGAGLTLHLHYNSLLFRNDRIDIIAEQLGRVITHASANPSIGIGAISLVTPRQKAALPDPTRDLHWGEFRGAIHDIFSANAKKHPNRLCVLETKSPFDDTTKDRPFTYKQIDEASNILAHHLISKGISLGDVVTVYAFRGVDLVVSVMGVLKAGATFSVIDPAYPAARQNIYLNVAQPKGLIVLKKAGTLAMSVRKYIETELSLLADVPQLELQDDGTLVGGRVDGKDVLAGQVELKGTPTGVVVGPDSTPTLSFTSGSEGIPKGVRGRHFSLTYYFPWMSGTFGLSETDKFTMLSGIAHDPIQRDIFTPLFLGAHLLVPTADDIGTPGRLAEWMAENGATVTHLTPAMGQLLSAQATAAIPSLHHAFFVGDILTKRDCLRLQALARNVFIVNMYGTTETQRAVSYFEVASIAKDPTFLQSQKDVIVAGQGMLDVQLIVVNRHDRQQSCGVGEVGEIYVRAGGLAEGYLRLPDLTDQKFVKSWFVPAGHWADQAPGGAEPWREFWMGPRDRLYRTGDLGRYTPDGNVECSGRADDQVKIRGFRIELGEIDTHLSQHPLVRENVTLVKRDKDEEPTLVSYVVPQNTSGLDDMLSGHESLDEEPDPIVKGLVKYRRLIKDIRDYLKTKLPTYAVPTVIVPLARMPLNPNGKIDKPALPFPDTVQLAAVASRGKSSATAVESTFTSTQATIRDVWLDILPQRPASLAATDSFFDVGGHSILATRMIFEVRKKFVVDLPLGFIYSHPTIAELASQIESINGSDLAVPQEEVRDQANRINGMENSPVESGYAADAKVIVKELLPEKYESVSEAITPGKKIVVLLTGATGFLGSYIAHDILAKHGGCGEFKLILHVRATSPEAGLQRFKSSALAYGVWDDAFAAHISVVTGSLEQERLGVDEATWKMLVDQVDVIVHNGAQVHWVYPYAKLRGPNVLGTVWAMALAAEGKPKTFSFVSSTSAIDSEHYVRLSDALTAKGGDGILEEDDLQGSKAGLANGYGQSKWAAEYVVREAGRRGLTGAIIRPGYVTGESKRGITNTDDFIVRMIKGCTQLGLTPDIYNTVNMVPVDHVARVVVAASFYSPRTDGLQVVHVTGHPRLRFNEFLDTLATYGYKTKKVDYIPWRIALERYVVEDSNDNALYPLLHFVLDNLPQSTKAPELDDRNAVAALKFDTETWTGEDVSAGKGITEATMGVYLAYLVEIGFLDRPGAGKKPLPSVALDDGVMHALLSVGGRGGLS
ncbi:hypothetical protein POJ06DRAFT_303633 [Lipomyces tetrasporus]|uniref:Alpha-aminoadipate reductase n=1 Tax=Lipomyces tetrasporus TaxID=54092 RepID=A0AAD7QPD3_9ASCO|nr:uncharacterized protein POJ06DRAFT_303633 [Lipomyces tetrasporus]KAJ8097382.1 hypothetical protein POJ06DRAFT_303633 [Lipomyces tetrasporus]